MFAILRTSVPAARGYSTPWFYRGFATSSQTINALRDPHRKGFTMSEKLKQRLVDELKENAAKETPNPLNCNCLPFKGTREHEYMMDDVFEHLMEGYKKTRGS